MDSLHAVREVLRAIENGRGAVASRLVEVRGLTEPGQGGAGPASPRPRASPKAAPAAGGTGGGAPSTSPHRDLGTVRARLRATMARAGAATGSARDSDHHDSESNSEPEDTATLSATRTVTFGASTASALRVGVLDDAGRDPTGTGSPATPASLAVRADSEDPKENAELAADVTEGLWVPAALPLAGGRNCQ
jgi:hypothetical protein